MIIRRWLFVCNDYSFATFTMLSRRRSVIGSCRSYRHPRCSETKIWPLLPSFATLIYRFSHLQYAALIWFLIWFLGKSFWLFSRRHSSRGFWSLFRFFVCAPSFAYAFIIYAFSAAVAGLPVTSADFQPYLQIRLIPPDSSRESVPKNVWFTQIILTLSRWIRNWLTFLANFLEPKSYPMLTDWLDSPLCWCVQIAPIHDTRGSLVERALPTWKFDRTPAVLLICEHRKEWTVW